MKLFNFCEFTQAIRGTFFSRFFVCCYLKISKHTTPDLTITMIKKSLDWIGIKGFKTFSVRGMLTPDDVGKLEDVMTDARNLIKEYAINLPS